MFVLPNMLEPVVLLWPNGVVVLPAPKPDVEWVSEYVAGTDVDSRQLTGRSVVVVLAKTKSAGLIIVIALAEAGEPAAERHGGRTVVLRRELEVAKLCH